MRSHQRHFIRYAAQLGITDIVIDGTIAGHPRVTGIYAGHTVTFTVGSSKPSDQRARLNIEAGIRRRLAQLQRREVK
ncbi:MAG: hypothetical protein JNL34_08595 [Anaerolineae bacterium]|nr:hypothetical protein [Anaerolineae bacterium]